MSNPRDPDMQEKPAARAASIGCTGQMNSVQSIVCVFIVSMCSACLVGCDDGGDTAAITVKPQAGKIMNWSQIDSSIAVPTDAPVLQIDGGSHVGAQRDSDNRHDAELRLRGYHVIRVGYRQVVDNWPEVQALVMAAVAAGLHRRPR